MQGDEFEWDDAKAAANVPKHKLSFRAASRVFDDPLVLIEQDDSEDYGEARYLAIGLVEGLHRARRPHPHHLGKKSQQP